MPECSFRTMRKIGTTNGREGQIEWGNGEGGGRGGGGC